MIAPTFDHGNDSLWFVVGIMAMWCALVSDDLVTRLGIWSHGQTEWNPLYKKLMPDSLYKFWFNGAAGAFCDGALRFVLSIGLVVVAKAIGYATNVDCWLPFTIAGITGALVLRNYLKIRKIPVTKTVGQVS